MVKQEVLAALDAARGRYISGQELAAQLSVSRTAVWKAVAALRRDGIPIKAVTNRGYTLAQSVDVLNAAAVAAQLDEATVKALQIEVVDRLPGTNAALRSRADAGAREGLVLIAQAQSAGRGRGGHSFYSPPGGLYMSILLRPEIGARQAVGLTAMAAVAGAASATVAAVEKRTRKQQPPVPFNTTSLMAAASAEGLSPARTMRIAESLYMDGYISYPRVDNTVYPSSLDLAEVVKTISGNPAYAPYCQQLLSAGELHATRGKKETTDHPPIYPTAKATPDDLAPADYKLYNLIARRFLATLSDAAVVEGTKVTLEVGGEHFAAKGDVLVTPGYRAIYPYGMKKDEQLPAMSEGQQIAFNGAECTKKQTEPPVRYSQGKLIQEMEKLGLGTKSTRHSIIERLYTVKYIQNDPIEPSQLGMAVCDALDKFAPHITHPQMTAELEEEMDNIAEGRNTKDAVVTNSRNLLSEQLANLLPHSEEVKDALADAVAADAYVGKCPKCGKDLQIRVSQKTRGMFIGCAGWPDCDVTYPLPKGKVEALPDPCPTCGMPQVKVTAFRSKPRTLCIDPNCETNKEPDVVVGECPKCAEAGKKAKLIAQKNPRTLKRFIRCENYDECGVGYPLPQYGAITATDEVCEHCGAPMVIVTTTRGPWKLCPNFSCPGKEIEAEKKAAAKEAKAAAKKAPAKKAAAKKPAAKKTTAKKAAAAKTEEPAE